MMKISKSLVMCALMLCTFASAQDESDFFYEDVVNKYSDVQQ